MTKAALHDDTSAARVTCHRCLSHYRIRALEQLTRASRSTCPTCGARFAVVDFLPSDSAEDAPTRRDMLSAVPDLSSTPGATASMSSPIRAAFHGMGGTLLGMHVVNVCLTLVTLGGYHFWAKAKIRRYLFSQTSFAGDRFVYHGTGKELYEGFLKAMLVFGIPYFFLSATHTFLELPQWIDVLLQAMAGLVFFLYVPVAIVNARRVLPLDLRRQPLALPLAIRLRLEKVHAVDRALLPPRHPCVASPAEARRHAGPRRHAGLVRFHRHLRLVHPEPRHRLIMRRPRLRPDINPHIR